MNEPKLLEEHLIFQGNSEPHQRIAQHTDSPPWRRFAHAQKAGDGSAGSVTEQRGKGYFARPEEIRAVNIAIYLRRPLLVTGDPGTGKSTLAHAIAYELGLGEVLVWPITSRSTLQQGLYQYDAIGRLQEASLRREQGNGSPKPELADIGRFIRLGPLGTGLYLSKPERPSVLLIDEIDKSDIDLPNDLLHVFEEGEFEIPELSRLPEDCANVPVWLHHGAGTREVTRGRVRCEGFPIVLLTSNGERDFPPAFLRRCVRLDIKAPKGDELAAIVAQRVDQANPKSAEVKELIRIFEQDRDDSSRELATDQLLNAVYLLTKDVGTLDLQRLREIVFRPLSNAPPETPAAPQP